MIDRSLLLRKKDRLEKEMDKTLKEYARLRMQLMDMKYKITIIDDQIDMGVSSKAKKGKQL